MKYTVLRGAAYGLSKGTDAELSESLPKLKRIITHWIARVHILIMLINRR